MSGTVCRSSFTSCSAEFSCTRSLRTSMSPSRSTCSMSRCSSSMSALFRSSRSDCSCSLAFSFAFASTASDAARSAAASLSTYVLTLPSNCLVVSSCRLTSYSALVSSVRTLISSISCFVLLSSTTFIFERWSWSSRRRALMSPISWCCESSLSFEAACWSARILSASPCNFRTVSICSSFSRLVSSSSSYMDLSCAESSSSCVLLLFLDSFSRASILAASSCSWLCCLFAASFCSTLARSTAFNWASTSDWLACKALASSLWAVALSAASFASCLVLAISA
mmetsp:Transcript_32043/g.43738  ORF Transcript_32043/g.43738 Transcript_32043/m.43738 type:complete len:282 (-) Transcript_32043:1140-1985(-)